MKPISSSTTLDILSLLDSDYTIRLSLWWWIIIDMTCLSLLEAVLLSCQSLMSDMPLGTSALAKQIQQFKFIKSSRFSQIGTLVSRMWGGTWNKLVWSLYWRQKSHFHQSITRSRDWTLQLHIETGLWMTGRGWFGLIRLKSMGWGCMEGNGCRKSPGRSWMEGLLSLHSNLDEGLWWCGAVSPGIGLGMDARLMERWI